MRSRSYYSRRRGFGLGWLTVLGILAIGFVLGGLCFKYVINFWLGVAGQPADFSFIAGALIGLIPGLGEMALLFAGITYIASFFI